MVQWVLVMFMQMLNVQLVSAFDAKFLNHISNLPVYDNPFFAKMVSLGESFNADGIEVGEKVHIGYICDFFGNLHCEAPLDISPQPQCYGEGVIDCTSECSGTEDELKIFLKFIKDEEDIFKKYSLYEANSFINKDKECEVENTDQKDGMTPLNTLDK